MRGLEDGPVAAEQPHTDLDSLHDPRHSVTPRSSAPSDTEGHAATGARANFDTRLMAKALAGLFAAGATLALVTLVLPHSQAANEIGLSIISIDAYLTAGVLYRWSDRLPPWSLRAALASGTVHITGVAYFSAESPSPLVFFYLWVFLYASYFFTRTETVAQIAFVGVAYGALLAAAPPPTGIAAWWLVGVGTLVVAAFLIVTMRERADRLIARLYDAARKDPLTLMLNRRGFRELLDLELERSHRSETPMSVLIGDIDFFKEVNDRSGHHVGDLVLQRAAAVLETFKRQIDVAARVGGEEFALILPDTDASGAYVLAERIRSAFAEAFAGDTIAITISFGVASFPAHGETAGAILRAGDEALYGAKQNGRNRTVIHSPELREAHQQARGARDIEGERYLAVVLELAEAVDLRFSGSARHSETVGRYAEGMAKELGLPEPRVNRVRIAGVLHDVGKVGVPDSILNKPGRLDEEEWHKIRQHPELGAQILEHPALADLREWVGGHHERPDGKGYPRGLSGDALSLETRILAVADAYEAMTSDRSYRSSIGQAQARAELRRYAGTQFDPRVVGALLTVLDRESERAAGFVRTPAPGRAGTAG